MAAPVLRVSQHLMEHSHEGQDIGQENLPELQSYPTEGCGQGHLYRPAPQTAAGLKP
jgi:hypothetical protein